MCPDLGAAQPRMVLQLTLGGRECVADGDMGIFMGLVVGAGPVDDDAPAGDVQFDRDPEQPALLLVAMGRLDDHAAADDAVEEPLEMRHAAMDVVADGIRDGHVTEFDLRRVLHGISLSARRTG